MAGRTVETNYAVLEEERGDLFVLKEGVTEYDIQNVWFHTGSLNKEWKTEEGHQLKILSTGHLNAYSGPDFKDALIEINGVPFRGDIEIHWKGKDWYQHGHHRDKRYDRVLLHVIMSKEAEFIGAITSSGHAVPTLIIGDFFEEQQNLQEEPFVKPKNINLKMPQCLKQIEYDYETLVRILAQQRVFQRVEQMRSRFREVSLNELIYEFLFYGLGMGTRYASIYLKLAQQIPYSQASIWAAEEPRLLEAVFLSSLGYLQKGVELKNPYALLLNDIKNYFFNNNVSCDVLQDDIIHRVVSVYPVANPSSRMALMVGILSKVETSLSEFLFSLCEKSLCTVPNLSLWEKFFNIQHFYWSYYNTWEMKRSKVPHALIGKERVYSILGNILFPFFIFCIQEGLWGQREEKIWELYFRLPGENSHWLLKKMQLHAEFLFPDRKLKFFEQQALIQWYRTGCSIHPQCLDCPWNSMKPFHSQI